MLPFPVNVWHEEHFFRHPFLSLLKQESQVLHETGLQAFSCINHEFDYESEIYGVTQLQSIHDESLVLFQSKMDKVCLRCLFDFKCFTGEAEELVIGKFNLVSRTNKKSLQCDRGHYRYHVLRIKLSAIYY